ncbi:sigma-70 family RNA polymerase sigma factor [Streptomyces sp. SL13]|uniref:Sigma-70 family RNA polymerase sigma factor n=1 Tax=Streptantibioticus silvisoli TaxID=2705255 RepID=A0AA90H9I4_9ACTN|nr:sigma-70 family RNA polymerase sigma factor [Streptantibioticus silvisoli]MDI5971330.1 sigma-70 family RNA polymerase sigma factor [Streptantibioticus silvisoli]
MPDTELVARVRGGDEDAFGELYRRHAPAVRRYARTCCRDPHTAEDLTGEVFARTLQAVRGGRGPESAVRAYLLTTVRRVAADWAGTARRERLVEDFAVFAVSAAGAAMGGTTGGATTAGADVRAMREADRSLVVRAFRTLPERWQAVLWHTAVEQESPGQIAPLLGLTPNATAVLAHRAREGLRQAYLQAHVSRALTDARECGRFADRLGAHARGGLRLRADRELRKHLAGCARCRAAAADIADINATLGAVLPVSVIGWFAAAYAAKVAGAVGVAAGAGAVAAGAASTGAASGGAAGGAAASEGFGLPAKIGIAAGVVVAGAGVALAAALVSGSGSAPAALAHGPSQAASTPGKAVPPHAPPRAPRTPGRARPARPAPAAVPPSVRAAPVRTVPVARVPPVVRRTPRASPVPRPAPRPVPSAPVSGPPPVPGPPVSSPVPAGQVYEVDSLPYGATGGADGPAIRPSVLSWVWQRHGLSIGGTTYANGVTVGAPSTVTVDLNRDCRSYDAYAGMDRLALGAGSLRFLVYGDDTLLYASGPVTAGDGPVPVHADLAGHATMRLVVVSDLAGLVEPADWADARISCD